MTRFCARIACWGWPLELTISPIRVHAWKAREKTALMRDASNSGRTRLAAWRIFSSISRVLGRLTLGAAACADAASTTFVTQNLAVGSSSSASLCFAYERQHISPDCGSRLSRGVHICHKHGIFFCCDWQNTWCPVRALVEDLEDLPSSIICLLRVRSQGAV